MFLASHYLPHALLGSCTDGNSSDWCRRPEDDFLEFGARCARVVVLVDDKPQRICTASEVALVGLLGGYHEPINVTFLWAARRVYGGKPESEIDCAVCSCTYSVVIDGIGRSGRALFDFDESDMLLSVWDDAELGAWSLPNTAVDR